MGDKDIKVEFSGRKIDYDSVKKSLNAQNENRQLKANITYCDLVNEIIPDSQMKRNIADVIDLMLTKEFEEIVTYYEKISQSEQCPENAKKALSSYVEELRRLKSGIKD